MARRFEGEILQSEQYGLASLGRQPSGCPYVSLPRRGPSFRYTSKTVKRIFPLLLLTFAFSVHGLADETSFDRIHVPDTKGRPVKAVLTFSDERKAVEIQPAKGPSLEIPFQNIDKFVYEYTQRHRVNEGTIITAPIGVGAAAMMTKERNHWLEIDYRKENVPMTYVIHMDKHNYLRVLDAVKKHTGMDAEVVGNADKRKR